MRDKDLIALKSLLNPIGRLQVSRAPRLPFLEHMAIKPRYRYIVEIFTPRDGGWVRWFNCFESAEDAQQAYRIFAPLAGFSHEIHLNMRVRKIIVFYPPRRKRRQRRRRRNSEM